MIRVGITGGMGSGKTTVCRMLEEYGVPVYYSDERGRELTDSDPDIRKGIRRLFGARVWKGERLDRAALARVAFSSPPKLAALNRLIHPAVGRDFADWCDRWEKDGAVWVALESAILFESGMAGSVDHSVAVIAPEAVRIERVAARDGLTAEEVEARIGAQLDERELARLAQYIIVNDGEHPLREQVEELDRMFRR